MTSPWMAAALAVLAPAALAADPADPAAPVPPPAYRSVFEGTPAGVEEGTVDWKKANAEVGQFPRGHVDLLRWEERQGGTAAPARPAASTPARTPPPTGHQH